MSILVTSIASIKYVSSSTLLTPMRVHLLMIFFCIIFHSSQTSMTRVPIKDSLKKLNVVHKKIITGAAVRNLTKGQTMADTLIDTRFKKLTKTSTYPKNTLKDRTFSISWKS
ncbi:hypothetical protein CDAR_451551 [Caerostris darwini]|uniref:Uncharacterized protein n=1 Tax=Caerostris darwini TaxID=1538125 RepID=A0AAV4UJP3_9ARAC|nr:hypothetical protein CDAR_451551 [Caerostris darwini]